MVVIFLVIMAAIGIVFYISYVPPKTPAGQQGSTYTPTNNNSTVVVRSDRSKGSVQAAYRAELAKHESDNTQLFDTIVVGEYAIQVYAGDIMGGQAVLKYDTSKGGWMLLDGGGGAWSLGTLMDVGVPQGVAEQLLSQLSQ